MHRIAVGGPRQKSRSKKTKKRLEIKRLMLEAKGTKNKIYKHFKILYINKVFFLSKNHEKC